MAVRLGFVVLHGFDSIVHFVKEEFVVILLRSEDIKVPASRFLANFDGLRFHELQKFVESIGLDLSVNNHRTGSVDVIDVISGFAGGAGFAGFAGGGAVGAVGIGIASHFAGSP